MTKCSFVVAAGVLASLFNVRATDSITVGPDGRPVYDQAPLPTYADSALTSERRAKLEKELPERFATLQAELATVLAEIDSSFQLGQRTSCPLQSFQYERITKRREMTRKLIRYIAFELKKGTVSSLCQAETGLANLEAFITYYRDEIAAWKVYPGAPHVTPKTFNVRDFGAKGDGVTDDEPAFQRALAAIRALKGAPSVLRIPAGEYLLMAKPNPVNGKRAIWFDKVVNCLVTGESEETTKLVYGDYDGNGINFRDWENSTLACVQNYWRETPFCEGEVESVDRSNGSLVLRHHEGSLKPNDPRFPRIGHPNSCMQFDTATHEPIRSSVLWYDYRCEDLGEGRYRLFFVPDDGATKFMPVKVGATFVVPDRDNTLASFAANNSRFFTFDRVWVRNSRCGTFCPGMCYQPTVYRCRISPRDPRFCLSTNADGNYTSPGTAILHCDFTNMNDDGSNAHTRGQLLFSCEPETGRYRHGSNWGWEHAGDFVQVVSSLDGRYLMNTRVKTLEWDPETRERQFSRFVDPLPATVNTYTSLGIEPYDYLTRRKIFIGSLKVTKYPDQFYVPFSQGVGYVASDNRFANIRGVAIQVQTPCSLIESNRIENIYRGIELSGLLHYQEGPPPYNVTIRGNVIKTVNVGVKSRFMTVNHPPAVTTPMAMLLIEGNVIENASERVLVLNNAEDVLVRDNVFSPVPGSTGVSPVEISLCRDVKFTGNTLSGQSYAGQQTQTNHVVNLVFAQ